MNLNKNPNIMPPKKVIKNLFSISIMIYYIIFSEIMKKNIFFISLLKRIMVKTLKYEFSFHCEV